ncbi:MAG: hypothetical protein D6715_03645 [Calditrichaeota bacterium]|nr:MAG: hypothetical protein D6715_03645 [Calditrichota bacterium]
MVAESHNTTFWTYLLFSPGTGKLYISQTADLEARLQRHNQGRVRSTRAYRPWHLLAAWPYHSRNRSMQAERKLKALKSKRAVLEFIEESPPPVVCSLAMAQLKLIISSPGTAAEN